MNRIRVQEKTDCGVNHGRSERNTHGQWLPEPVIDSICATQSVEDWKFDAFTHLYHPPP
jgi:hypothetical protein